MKNRFLSATLASLLVMISIFLVSCIEEEPTASNGNGSEEPAQNLSIGQSAQTSTERATVISATKVYSFEHGENWLGNPYTEEAPEGKAFIIIDARIENIGDDSLYAIQSDFSLTDSEGYKYDVTYYPVPDDGFESQEIYEGQQSRGKILFEVPDGATGLRVQYDFGTFETLLATWIL